MAKTKGKEKNKSYVVDKAVADLTDDPANGIKIGRRDSQLLFGESFKAEKTATGGWIYGASVTDGYTGYVRKEDLKPEKEKPTHVVDRLLTHVYPKPDLKTHPVMALSFMSRIAVLPGSLKEGFLKTPLGWIYKPHLKKISDLKNGGDYMAAAIRFLGCPYLYGGRSAFGIDCSALVQLSLHSCGIACPRDSDQQIVLGRGVAQEESRRGDLVFFRMHVGLLIDREHVINATARTMDTRIERLSDLADAYKGIVAIRRI